MIAAPARFHADLVVAAAAAGKAVFCEKPMALTLADADRAIDAARAAGVVLQVGFNRRFAAGLGRRPGAARRRPARHAAAAALAHPRPGRLRPGPGRPGHDLPGDADPRLRHAAVPQPRREGGRGLRDRGRPGGAGVAGPRPAGHRAWSSVRFDNGAIGTAEACFEAAYGYDVRGEVFGSRRHGHHGRRPRAPAWCSPARPAERPRPSAATRSCCATPTSPNWPPSSTPSARGAPGAGDRRGRPRRAGDRPGRSRVGARRPPGPDRRGGGVSAFPAPRLAVSAEMVFLDLPFVERVRRIADARLRGGDLGLDRQGHRRAGRDRRHVLVDDRLHHRHPGRPGRRRRTAAHRGASLEVAEQLDCPRLNLHGTGLDDGPAGASRPRSSSPGDVADRRAAP